MNLFATLDISLRLTDKGLDVYEDVIEYIFKYLNIIKSTPI